MKHKVATEAYLEKAKLLSDAEVERVFSRMGGKLRRRRDKDKVNSLEALAIQLELEDEMLAEWREHFAEIKAKHDKKALKDEPEAEPVQESSQKQPKAKPEAKAKSKPERQS